MLYIHHKGTPVLFWIDGDGQSSVACMDLSASNIWRPKTIFGDKISEMEGNTIAMLTWKYMPPVIIILGTVGNLLTILAVNTRKLNSFTVYLGSLAFTDILVLYTQTFNLWLENVLEIKLKLHSEILCKLYYFFIFLCPQISSWLIMCLTVERTICTFFSTRVRQFPGPKVGLSVVGSIVCGLCVLNGHALYGRILVFGETRNSTRDTCGFVNDLYMDFYYRYWSMINFVTYFAIPIIIIILGNSITSYSVYKSGRSIMTMVESSGLTIIKQKIRHVFLITLLVSIAFIVLVTPLPLLFLFNRVNTMDFPAALFVHMVSLNHSINFLLYIVSGNRFRKDLKVALRRLCRRKCETTDFSSISDHVSAEMRSRRLKSQTKSADLDSALKDNTKNT